MTDIDETIEVEKIEQAEGETPEPFLRIHGSYPVGADQYASVTLEMNPGQLDAGGDVVDAAWLTGFCRQIVTAMQSFERGAV